MVDDLETFEMNHPELVAIDLCGRTTERKIEFLSQEREEMRQLTSASKISHNVYLGNTADVFNQVIEYIDADRKVSTKGFDVAIEAKDMVEVASAIVLKDTETFLNGGAAAEVPHGRRGAWYARCLARPLTLDFPTSTPITSSRHDPEAIVTFCEWIYHITHSPAIRQNCEDCVMAGTADAESPATSRLILIHCQDGYTESSFLALAYLIFAEGITAHEAWVKLHTDLHRSFFAFDADLKALNYLQPFLLSRSPKASSSKGFSSSLTVPSWFKNEVFDGSFPSRILPHMYLGNLQHANNPEMLRALGITRVLSIGEQVTWDKEKEERAGMQLMLLDNVQDNGIDPLLDYIDPCLNFLGTLFVRRDLTDLRSR